MSGRTKWLAVVAMMAWIPSAVAWATGPTAPAYLPVQGYLTDASGKPVNGQVNLTVSLWAQPSGGITALYQETQTVQADQGSFSLYLGQNGAVPLDLSLFRDHPTLFVGVSVNGAPELAPRYQLATTPYAAVAQYAGSVDWSGITNVPSTVGQGSPLGGLSCASGQVAKWDGTAWACAADEDTTLSESTVDQYVSKVGYAKTADLSKVATTGAYADLTGQPATVGALSCASGQVAKWNGTAWACATDQDSTLSESTVDQYVAKVGYAKTADLAKVATTGAYTDLTGKPATVGALSCANGQVAKWNGATWACASDKDTTLSEVTVDQYVSKVGYAKTANLAKVATTGAYSDLTGRPATVGALACQYGQVAKWNGAAWACAADSNTTYTAGANLTLSGNAFALSTPLPPSTISGTAATLTGDQTFTGRVTAHGVVSTGSVVATGQYTYSAWQYGKVDVPAADFRDISSPPPCPVSRNEVGRKIVGPCSTASGFDDDESFAVVHDLPKGAELTALHCWYLNPNPGGDLRSLFITFGEGWAGAAAWSTVATIDASTPAVSANYTGTEASVSLPTGTVVANQAYFVHVQWLVDLNFSNPPEFRGCKIDYRTNAISP